MTSPNPPLPILYKKIKLRLFICSSGTTIYASILFLQFPIFFFFFFFLLKKTKKYFLVLLFFL